jgi:hypothetical protein
MRSTRALCAGLSATSAFKAPKSFFTRGRALS